MKGQRARSPRGRTAKRKTATAGGGGRSTPLRAPRRPGRLRTAEISRTTRETEIRVKLDIDGSGQYTVATGVPFLDHMLETFARHGLFDLTVTATGDLRVDAHHTVEDVGLTIGQAFRDALGDKVGIRRFGEATVPLDEALVSVVVDLSGRPYLAYDVTFGQGKIGTFDVDLVHDYLQALTTQVGMNLHVTCERGRNPHHIVEATFKGLARALDAATQFDTRLTGVLSTKGVL